MSVNIVNKSTGALTKIAGNPVEQASGISYDHTSSGMQANNVQAAVDELMSGLTDLTNVVGWGVDGGNVLIPMANGEKNGVTFARVFDSTGYVVSYSLSGATTRDNTSVIMYELPVKDSDTKYKIKVFNIPTVHIIWDDTSSSTIPLGTGVITVPANHSVFIGMYVATAGTDVTGGSVQIMATTNTDNPMDTYYPTRPVIGSAVADMKSRIEAVESGLTDDSFDITTNECFDIILQGSHYITNKVVHICCLVKANSVPEASNITIAGLPSGMVIAQEGMIFPIYKSIGRWEQLSSIVYGYVSNTSIVARKNDIVVDNYYYVDFIAHLA